MFIHANMVKKMPSIKFSNSTDGQIWGLTRTCAGSSSGEDDIDADHLANTESNSGHGIKQAPSKAVAERALAEAGLKTYFQSTSIYVNCINRRWSTTNTNDNQALHDKLERVKGAEATKPKRAFSLQSPQIDVLWVRMPVTTSARAALNAHCDQEDDDRLRGFEQAFWEVGGKPTGKCAICSSNLVPNRWLSRSRIRWIGYWLDILMRQASHYYQGHSGSPSKLCVVGPEGNWRNIARINIRLKPMWRSGRLPTLPLRRDWPLLHAPHTVPYLFVVE